MLGTTAAVISGSGSERRVRPADTSRHDAVDRCSDEMRMTVVVAVVRKIVVRADERTCSGGGSGAEKAEQSSTVAVPYPRRRVCSAATVSASSCSLYWHHPQLRTSFRDRVTNAGTFFRVFHRLRLARPVLLSLLRV